jgi:hypothetical protein
MHIKRESFFRRDLLWDWDIRIIWLARPHCPTSLKCDGHKEKNLGEGEIEWLRKETGQKTETGRRRIFSLYPQPLHHICIMHTEAFRFVA